MELRCPAPAKATAPVFWGVEEFGSRNRGGIHLPGAAGSGFHAAARCARVNLVEARFALWK